MPKKKNTALAEVVVVFAVAVEEVTCPLHGPRDAAGSAGSASPARAAWPPESGRCAWPPRPRPPCESGQWSSGWRPRGAGPTCRGAGR